MIYVMLVGALLAGIIIGYLFATRKPRTPDSHREDEVTEQKNDGLPC